VSLSVSLLSFFYLYYFVFLFIFCLPIKRKVVIHSAREICDKAEGSSLPEAASSNLPLCSSYLVSHSSPSIPTRLPLDARTNLKILFTPPVYLFSIHAHTHAQHQCVAVWFILFICCMPQLKPQLVPASNSRNVPKNRFANSKYSNVCPPLCECLTKISDSLRFPAGLQTLTACCRTNILSIITACRPNKEIKRDHTRTNLIVC